jgi:hypothetical protein
MTPFERLCARPTESDARAPNIGRLGRKLLARQQNGPARPVWRKTSPSAELMVVRCTVRDTRAPGADRFQWSVNILGWPHPIAVGRAAEAAKAREHVEAALADLPRAVDRSKADLPHRVSTED